jgi:hypothetical protein
MVLEIVCDGSSNGRRRVLLYSLAKRIATRCSVLTHHFDSLPFYPHTKGAISKRYCKSKQKEVEKGELRPPIDHRRGEPVLLQDFRVFNKLGLGFTAGEGGISFE